ncbi:helix-turn-helix domain-containing protein [Nocardia altamirensis]|uniref:helix-turn-helix domain-containing protein n=1 Tax=Nocardia altamirensis TaxID=472158 RepID=UPI0009FDDA67|nr:helix-turn-helix transcriptional regulator [Nocardia altamirensis]
MRLTSGETLRALMHQRGHTMDSLSQVAGCSRSFIGQLCTGDKPSCSAELAARIVEALEVPIELLFVPAKRAVSDISTRTLRGVA